MVAFESPHCGGWQTILRVVMSYCLACCSTVCWRAAGAGRSCRLSYGCLLSTRVLSSCSCSRSSISYSLAFGFFFFDFGRLCASRRGLWRFPFRFLVLVLVLLLFLFSWLVGLVQDVPLVPKRNSFVRLFTGLVLLRKNLLADSATTTSPSATPRSLPRLVRQSNPPLTFSSLSTSSGTLNKSMCRMLFRTSRTT